MFLFCWLQIHHCPFCTGFVTLFQFRIFSPLLLLPFWFLVKERPWEQSFRFQDWSFWVCEFWSLHKSPVISSGCVGLTWLWKIKGVIWGMKMGVVTVFQWVCVFWPWTTTQFVSKCWRLCFANASIRVRCF